MSKSRAIVALGLILIIVLATLVWDKQPTIYPYLCLAIAFSGVLTFSIIRYHQDAGNKFSVIFLIFIAFLFLRNVQFISTHYSALMPADVTWEYAVINTFSEQGQISTIPASTFSDMLTWYSSWPAFHTLSLIFGDILGIKLSVSPVILPTILGSIGFLLVYVLTDKLTANLKLNKTVVPMCLLLYAVSPEAIYYGFKFVRQGMGVALVLVGFYLLYEYIVRRDFRFLALSILNALVIVLSHHYTSFVFSYYLLAFAGLTFILALVLSRVIKIGWLVNLSKLRKQALIVGIVGLIAAASIFVWWNQVGTVIHGVAGGVTARIVAVVEQTIAQAEPSAQPLVEVTPFFPKWHYPSKLTPPWVNLLWVRDFLIYVPVLFGFAWLLRKRLKSKSSNGGETISCYFLVFSLSCFGALFLFELFISHVEPYRVILLSLPFIALCSAILYVEMLSHVRWLRWLAFGILVFVITTSFLGLWGHRHAPVHLYSSVISHQEVGEAVPLDDRYYALQQFVAEHELASSTCSIFSDNNWILYQLLPPQEYGKIGPGVRELPTELHNAVTNGDALLAIDFGSGFYSYYYGATTPEEAQRLQAQYRYELEASLNKIYYNNFGVWVKQ
jgi:hypothetical protein